jgi:hypothetical protein
MSRGSLDAIFEVLKGQANSCQAGHEPFHAKEGLTIGASSKEGTDPWHSRAIGAKITGNG